VVLEKALQRPLERGFSTGLSFDGFLHSKKSVRPLPRAVQFLSRGSHAPRAWRGVNTPT
jgi:hypothetical protein